MTNEQFKFWLKGFLEDKKTLNESDIKKIMDTIRIVCDYTTFIYDRYYTPNYPLIIYGTT